MQHRQKILYIFTRTPLHVGAGSSVGAIDQPIQRERHTGFPIIPASSLKGSFADQWEANLEQDEKRFLRVTTRKDGDEEVVDRVLDSAWLFGSNNERAAFTGAIQFGEARLLVFPIRSAKGSFAWITSPLILRRAARDGVLDAGKILSKEPRDDEAVLCANSALLLGTKQVVLEEYTFSKAEGDAKEVAEALAYLLKDENGEDPVWKEVATRLVILSDGMMSFFVRSACEVAQHVRIDDATGTAASGALFNQENVPSETLFYSVLQATQSRLKADGYANRNANDALDAFRKKLNDMSAFQFGGDASTGLGYCTVKLAK
jgi:CRISPR-associated protein Cmr4